MSKKGLNREAGGCLLMPNIINKKPVIIVLLDSYGKYTRIADAKRIRKWMEKNINQSRASTQFKNIIMQPS